MNHPECACELCRAPCKTMPGLLAVADLAAFASQVLGPDAMDSPERFAELAAGKLLASGGSSGMKNGQLIQLQTLVPAQQPDGHCVFLTPEDHCGLHGTAAKPFGCRTFKVCEHVPLEGHKQNAALSAVYFDQCEGGFYNRVVHLLAAAGHAAPPLAERRQQFYSLLERIRPSCDAS